MRRMHTAVTAALPRRHRRTPAARPARAVIGLSLAALVMVGQATLASTALGATPSTIYDFARTSAFDPQAESRFGDRMKSAGDLDGDGVGDVWIGVYQYDLGMLANAGRVYAVSGRDRSLLYRIESPEPQGQPGPGGFFGFGWSISNLGDVDGDGVNDLVVGSVRHNVNAAGAGCAPGSGCNVGQGKAWVFSGAPGKPKTPLYALNNPRPQPGGAFGWASTAGDVVRADGTPGQDGISEILVGAFQNDFALPDTPAATAPAACGNLDPVPAGCRRDQGQAFVFNGALGVPAAERLVRTLDVPPLDRYVDGTNRCVSPNPAPTGQACGALGIVNEGLGDVNGDGFWDHSVTAWTTGVTAPPAVDSPGRVCYGDPATAPNTPGNGCNERQGRIYVYSGRDGALLHRIDNPEPQENALFGLQIVEAGSPGDVNGDGSADIYGNGFVQDTPQTSGPAEGKSWVFNGRDGRLLYGLTDPTPEPGGQFGYSLDSVDHDKDGLPDLYIGSSPHHEPGSAQLGGTYVFRGVTGSLLRIFDLPSSDVQVGTVDNNGPQLGRSVAAPGDLNGDGEPDYLAGAPTLDIGDNRNEGRLYAFLSAPSPTAPSPMPTAPPPPPAEVGKHPAKLSLARATIKRRDRVLDVLAPITRLASGRVNVELHAAGRRFRFTAPINSRDGRIRFRKRIPKAQAELGTGIITITYRGDADTRPQTVRLRAAHRPAQLRLSRPRIVDGRLRAAGRVSDLARGVVRLQLEYDRGGQTRIVRFRARIANGRWALNRQLSERVRTGIAQRAGSLHSYTLFTGYYPRRMRGEMRSFQVLGPR